MEAIAGILLLATLIEGLITYLFGDADTKPWLKYVSLVLGIFAAIAYQIDIPAMFGLASQFTLAGYILSGIIIGRGSNYLNDIIGKVRG